MRPGASAQAQPLDSGVALDYEADPIVATSVFIGSGFIAQYPNGGGLLWLPVQYVLGLRELGHEARWLEVLWTRGDPAVDRELIDRFWQNASDLGVREHTVLAYYPDGVPNEPRSEPILFGMAAGEFRARAGGSLLLNMANAVGPALRAGFGRTALFDIDPGAFQLWAREWDMGIATHDAHLTIGMNLGEPDSPIPLVGVPWRRVWPAVHLASWPVQPPPAPGARYTTVTQWWNDHYAFLDGDCYDCNKRSGFMPILSLPGRVGLELEIAANLHPGEAEDRALLAEHGWRLVDPDLVAGSGPSFRRYVQASRGECSATKPAYVKARAGWISDRTVCYLASGRPCVLEDTGALSHLPPSAGLRFFATLDEAADALRAVEGDWAQAARAARVLAEEVFSTRVVLPELLAAAGA